MFTFAQSGGREVTVPRIFLGKLPLFKRWPELVNRGRYTITSNVGREVVDLFFARVMGDEADVVTAENAEQLRALCDELGFTGFDDEIRAVLGGDSRARKDLVSLRGRVDRHDVIIEELQRRVLELERQLREQWGSPERVEAAERRVEVTRRSDVERAVAEATREAEALREDVQRLRMEVSDRTSAADVAALSDEVSRLKDGEARRATMPQAPRAEAVAPAGSEFGFDASRPWNLDGIIAHLQSECGGNVHKNGAIKVTASSCERSGREPENAVDLGSDSEFCSKNSRNSWICYDFERRRVTVTSYSIRSYGYGPGYGHHPKSWVLEVSNDGSEGSWAVVDSRESNFDLDGKFVTRNFAVSAPPSGAFRFVRLRHTGKNHRGDDYLAICALELFGALSGG